MYRPLVFFAGLSIKVARRIDESFSNKVWGDPLNPTIKFSLFLFGLLLIALSVYGCWKINKESDLVVSYLTEPLIISKSLIKVNSDSKIDTSDWQTYHNEKHGYEIKYPRDWEAVEMHSSYEDVAFYTDDEETKALYIDFYDNPDRLSSKQYVEKMLSDDSGPMPGMYPEKEQEFIIDGLSAYEITVHGGDDWLRLVYIAKDQWIILLEISTGHDPQHIHDLMLSTLKFH